MKVAIFGAGTMGSGIAQVMAAHGHTVLMYASSVASAQRHKDKLGASLERPHGLAVLLLVLHVTRGR